ncbi:endonuclease/exonuclease/phosphatase family protein [Gillisia sp. Q332]|uniref:endonuclease/exonuclease/phosphatase family protein n=1 Tax=Gillisia xinjiangensis TaxID=3384765 RepID=UPI00391AC81D
MSIPEIILAFFSILMLLPTLASLTKYDKWWIRGFDFPRIQISFLILLIISLSLVYYTFRDAWHSILVILLIGSFIYQAVKIFPYTIFAKKQVHKSKGSDPKGMISLLISNVLATNKRSDKLIAHVQTYKPDLLLTLESDQRWENELSVLEDEYIYKVKIPKDNFYGMHLYSKLKLEHIEIKYLISDEIPSIHGYLWLRNGVRVRFHCLHPKPPSPSEDDTSTNRDAELLLVGRELNAEKESVLVFGDLNDVAWSRTTKLFQKLSGLLDPRIGRGFYNTFHADYSLLRWPLDHVFHTIDFTLIKLKCLKSINSDHFPVFIKLNYDPGKKSFQERPEKANGDEKEWANEKIEDGNPQETDI